MMLNLSLLLPNILSFNVDHHPSGRNSLPSFSIGRTDILGVCWQLAVVLNNKMRKNSFILEEHSWCRLFRTTKYYLYFSLLQLILSVALIATLIVSDREKAFPIEIVICLLLLSDMY